MESLRLELVVHTSWPGWVSAVSAWRGGRGLVGLRSPSWRSQCWRGRPVVKLSLPVSAGGTVHAASVVDIGPGVDIALGVRGEVIVLVVGRGDHSLGLGPVVLRSAWLVILNYGAELILGRLIVSLLRVGRWPRGSRSVFTSIVNIVRPRSSGRLLILRIGRRTVIILIRTWRSSRSRGFIVIVGRFGSIIIISGRWRSGRFIVNIRSMIIIIGWKRSGRRFVVQTRSMIIIIGGFGSRRRFVVNIGGFRSITVWGWRSVWRIIRRFIIVRS